MAEEPSNSLAESKNSPENQAAAAPPPNPSNSSRQAKEILDRLGEDSFGLWLAQWCYKESVAVKNGWGIFLLLAALLMGLQFFITSEWYYAPQFKTLKDKIDAQIEKTDATKEDLSKAQGATKEAEAENFKQIIKFDEITRGKDTEIADLKSKKDRKLWILSLANSPLKDGLIELNQDLTETGYYLLRMDFHVTTTKTAGSQCGFVLGNTEGIMLGELWPEGGKPPVLIETHSTSFPASSDAPDVIYHCTMLIATKVPNKITIRIAQKTRENSPFTIAPDAHITIEKEQDLYP